MTARGARFSFFVLALLSGRAAQAQFTWTGAGGNNNWSTPNNWNPVGPPTTGADVVFTTASTPSLNVNATVGTLSKTGAGTTTISATGTNALTINTGITKSAGVLNISADIILGSAGEAWSFNGNTNTFSGNISGASFTKTGAGGNLVLSGNNTFAGATVTVNALRATTSAALGTSATTITLAGGNLQLQGGGLTLPVGVVATGSENLNLGGAANSLASLTVASGATVTLTGGGTLSVGTLSGSGTIAGTVTVTGNLTPGTGGTGTLTTGALTLNAGTNLNFSFHAPPTTNSTTTTGRLTLNGLVNIVNAGGLAIGAYPVFTYNNITNGNTVALGTVPAGFSYGIRATTTTGAGTVFIDVGRKPSAATIVPIAAEYDGTASRIAWSAQESQNLGFRIWRDSGGTRKLISPGLVAGFALRARVQRAAGQSYFWTDSGAPNGGTYWIEAVDVQGRSDWTGPITTQQGTALKGVPASAFLTTPSQSLAGTLAPSIPSRVLGQVGAAASTNRSRQWALAAAAAVKLQVQDQGVYQVSAEQLFAAGIPQGTPVASLSLWAATQPVSFNVISADGVHLQAGDAIEFYGVGLDTYYTDTQVYWLTTQLAGGQLMGTASGLASSQAGTSFLETLVNPQHANYTDLPGIASSNRFYGSVLTPSYGLLLTDQEVFSTPLLDASSTSASTLAVAIQGLSPGPHAVNVLFNGTTIGSITGTGVQLMSGSFTLAPGLLLAGGNQVELVPQPSPGNSQSDVTGVASETLIYPRLLTNGGGPLQFTAPGQSSVALTGFGSGTRVLDVTNPLSPSLVAAHVDSTSGTLLVDVPGQGSRTLYAFQPSDIQSPGVVSNAPSSWHSAEGADLVIIAHASLLASVQPLVAQRQQEGLKVLAVDVQDVYDEFGFGEKSAAALQSFLQFASGNWGIPPSYVLLVGNGTYDPRGYFGSPELDLVPILQVETSQMYTASDDAFVTFGGQAQTIAIGRLPLRNAMDSAIAVQKILGRTLLSPTASFLFVQGTPRYVSDDFGADTALVHSVVSSWPSQQVGPLPDGGVDTSVAAALISAIKAGPAVVTYEGHGLEDSWYPTTLFSGVDTTALAGTGMSSVFLAATCLNGYFLDAEPASESLAEQLLRTDAGGAWAVWSSTGETNSTDHAAFSAALLQAAAVEGMTLGKATLAAKASESDPDVRTVFHLFGDPSSRLTPAKASGAIAEAGGVQAQASSGCGTPGSAALAVLPLVALALAFNARSRRSAAVRARQR